MSEPLESPRDTAEWRQAFHAQLASLAEEQGHLHRCLETRLQTLEMMIEERAEALQTAIDQLARRLAPLEMLKSIIYGVGIGVSLTIMVVLTLLPWLVRMGQLLEKKP